MKGHWGSKKKKKPEDLHRHFVMRCIQRIGVVINDTELKRRLQANELSPTWRESNTRMHFMVPKDLLPKDFGREIEVVYDSSKHEFVTILFKDGKEFEEFF